MLVLSREVNTEIIITTPEGRQITVMPLEVRGKKVRLGITADRDLTIHRREVYEAIKAVGRLKLTSQLPNYKPQPSGD